MHYSEITLSLYDFWGNICTNFPRASEKKALNKIFNIVSVKVIYVD